MSDVSQLQREIEQLTKENRILQAKLESRDADLKKLRAENRELKLRPPPRTYVDADDERESNAWREKANNLLTLLDDLQVSMKDDLLNLEAETLNPGSSSLSTPAKSKSHRSGENAAPAAAPAAAAAVDAAAPSSSSRRKKRAKSPEPLEDARDAVETVVEAVAAAPAAAAAAVSGGAADTTELTAAYKAMGAAAKHIHQRYSELKKTTGAAQDIWSENSEPVKAAAKAAKSVAGHRGEAINFGSAEVKDSTVAAAQAAKDWATNVKHAIHGQAADHSPAIKAAAKALHSSARKQSAAVTDLDLSSAASIDALTTHTNAVADALMALIDAEADWLLSL